MDSLLLALDPDALVKVISAILAGVAGLIWKQITEAKAKVVAFYLHSSAVTLLPQLVQNPAYVVDENGKIPEGVPQTIEQPSVTVNTHALVLRNNGGKAARHVRLGHTQPIAFSVNPPTNYEVIGTETHIPTLAPDEQLTITYVYFPPLTVHQVHTYLKTDEALIRGVNYAPSPVVPRWKRWLAIALLLVGAATLIAGVLRALYWFLTR
jgi:hypothetical protein